MPYSHNKKDSNKNQMDAVQHLIALQTVNVELRSIEKSFIAGIAGFSIHLTLMLIFKIFNDRLLYKFYYDTYEHHLNETTEPNHIKELMLDMLDILARCLNEKKECLIENGFDLKKSSIIIEKYWGACADKYFISNGTVSLLDLNNYISPNHLDNLLSELYLVASPLLSFLMVNELELSYSQQLQFYNNEESLLQLTKDKIQQNIQKIEKENTYLKNKIKIHHQLIKLTFLFLIIPFIIYFFLEEGLSVEINTLIISLMTPVIYNLYKGTKKSIRIRNITSQLTGLEKDIKKLFPHDLNVTIQPCQKELLKYSSIKLTFSEFTSISAPKMNRIIKSIFLMHHLPIENYNRTSFEMNAHFSLSPDKVEEIKENIASALQRFRETNELIRQLNIIFESVKLSGIPIPQSKNGLAEVNYLVTIHVHKYNDLIKILKSSFSSNHIHLNNDHISIEGHVPAAQDEFNKAIQQCKIFFSRLNPRPPLRHTESVLSSKPTFFSKPPTNELKLNTVFTEIPSSPKPLIKSKNSGNKIFEINLLTGRNIPPCFFTLFTLKRKDFGIYAGTKDKPGSYDKFADLAVKSNLAVSRTGATGFIFIDRWVRDRKGQFFHAEGMFKSKGAHGSERVFCDKKEIDGKVIYKTKSFEPNHP